MATQLLEADEMKVSILQPSYLPWIGAFDMMNKSDVFVFYDDVQYTKNDWRNRNRIKTPNGKMWLTIPVDYHLGMKINDVEFKDMDWREKHLKALKMNYSHSTYFKEVHDMLRRLSFTSNILSRFSMDLTVLFARYMGLTAHFMLSSQIGFKDRKKTDRVVAICKHLGADEYISGNAAKDYLEVEKFGDIKVTWHDYKHPIYSQQWGKFIPYLSIIDLLFNHGKKSKDLLCVS